MEYSHNWSGFVNELRRLSPSLGAIMTNSGVIEETSDQLKIDVFSNFHREQLGRPEFIKILQEAALNTNLPSKSLVFIAGNTNTANNHGDNIVADVMELLI
jgi:hypothetical protein